jgi:hypothetical protein
VIEGAAIDSGADAVGGRAGAGADLRDGVCRVGGENAEGVVVGRYRQRHQQPNVCTTCRGGCCAIDQTDRRLADGARARPLSVPLDEEARHTWLTDVHYVRLAIRVTARIRDLATVWEGIEQSVQLHS